MNVSLRSNPCRPIQASPSKRWLRLGWIVVALLAGCATAGPPQPIEGGRGKRPAEATQIDVLDVGSLEQSTQRETFNALLLLDDPLEPFNRFSLQITKPLLDWVVVPVAKAYRFAVPEPARRALDRASYNLTYPSRFVSLALQGEASRSGEETLHFLTNSTVGVAGLFDPASELGLASYPEDVGQAFARWGIGPGFYLFLPFFGPGSARDAVGTAFDTVLNPLFWVPGPAVPYVPVLDVATGASLALGVNSFSFRVDGYETLSSSFPDLYEPARALWSIQRQVEVENYRIPEEDFATADPEPSLGVLLLELDDPEFPARGEERSAKVRSTGNRLPYSLWLQPRPAPLLFLIPGVGAHRLSGLPVGIAEAAYQRGYSVAVISSPFHPEFIATALTESYPGYTPSDTDDLRVVLQRIVRDLRRTEGDRITATHLVGYSLGGIETLFIAAEQAREPIADLEFERFVAVNPPVDLLYAGRQFDAYFAAPERWPAAERTRRIRELAMKALLMIEEGLPEGAPPPFDRIESEFLVGFAGRATLTDALQAIRRRGAPGLSPDSVTGEASEALTTAILRSSFEAYFEKLAFPYFAAQLEGPDDPQTMVENAGLRPQGPILRERCDTFVVTNADDFILGDAGLAWLREHFGDRLTVFPSGGHLGNVHVQGVQDAIFDRLEAPACP